MRPLDIAFLYMCYQYNRTDSGSCEMTISKFPYTGFPVVGNVFYSDLLEEQFLFHCSQGTKQSMYNFENFGFPNPQGSSIFLKTLQCILIFDMNL